MRTVAPERARSTERQARLDCAPNHAPLSPECSGRVAKKERRIARRSANSSSAKSPFGGRGPRRRGLFAPAGARPLAGAGRCHRPLQDDGDEGGGEEGAGPRRRRRGCAACAPPSYPPPPRLRARSATPAASPPPPPTRNQRDGFDAAQATPRRRRAESKQARARAYATPGACARPTRLCRRGRRFFSPILRRRQRPARPGRRGTGCEARRVAYGKEGFGRPPG